jgi:hypothetical protein
MAESCKPRGAATRLWFIVSGQYAPDSILVQVQPESQIDLLCNSGASEPRVPMFDLDYGIDHISGRPFGTGLVASVGGIQFLVFLFYKRSVKSE